MHLMMVGMADGADIELNRISEADGNELEVNSND
jgi:hypothetical protein